MLSHSHIGNTIEIDIDVVDRLGAPLNISLCTFVFTAVTLNGDFSISKTQSNGIAISNTTVGRLRVTIPASATVSLLKPRNLLWEIVMTDTYGEIRTIAKGRIALSLPLTSLVV